MKNFENISAEDLQILENAVPQIALLVAGADGQVDKEETDWAVKLTHIRTYSGDKDVQDFYKEVEANFNIKLNDLMKNASKDTTKRQLGLIAELSKVNPILAKLDPTVAYHVYHSYVTFAKSVAKAGGGFLGFGSISSAEERVMGLPMITPIEQPKSDIAVEESEAE